MKDNLDKLFEAARAAGADTSRAEFGFETRLMARIRSIRERETPWFALAWRLIPAFALVVVALGAWDFATPMPDPLGFYAATSDNIDQTLLITFLTGG